jgi:hypothetical protein
MPAAQPTGFTTCLRVQFQMWRWKILYIISSNNITLRLDWDDFSLGYFIIHPYTHYELNWQKWIHLSPLAWNFYCVSYSHETNDLIVVVNDATVLNETVEYNISQDFSNSEIYFPQYFLFGTKLTDFNFWSRFWLMIFHLITKCNFNLSETLQIGNCLLTFSNFTIPKSQILKKVQKDQTFPVNFQKHKM